MNLPVVLVIDDEPAVLDSVRRSLRPLDIRLLTTSLPQQALELVESEAVAVIVADEQMPWMTGTELLARVRELRPDTVRLMLTGSGAATAVRAVNEARIARFLEKPCLPETLREAVREGLSLHRAARAKWTAWNELQEQAHSTRQELHAALRKLAGISKLHLEAQRHMLHNLAVAAELHDEGTGRHLARVGRYSEILAEAAGLDGDAVKLMCDAAPMHDVGKLAIPDSILRKPGPLSSSEWEIMRLHTIYGAQMLGCGEQPLIETSRIIALTHHENVDGSGYPNGLRGEEIPYQGRIVAIVDAFDALTSERAYQKAVSPRQAMDSMLDLAGTRFDGALLSAFVRSLDRVLEVPGRSAPPGPERI